MFVICLICLTGYRGISRHKQGRSTVLYSHLSSARWVRVTRCPNTSAIDE